MLGRDFEIRQVVDILLRRRQNNPILVGEAGVGKTAVVEGFALRIAQGDVPPPLRNVTLRTLDLALLQAGAGVKGEFENRLKGLIEEVKNSPTPIILFIDEAHTMIGAGGAAGQNDAANLLKPALARGELRTMAATTWSEYKKYFEKDPALSRRFQLVKVEEPSGGRVPADDARHPAVAREAPQRAHSRQRLDAAVRLSHRYLADRQLPDKAVSILDTACAQLALGQSATPSALEDAQRRIEDLAVQKRVLEREVAVGANHAERLAEIDDRARRRRKTALKALTERWEKEKGLVTEIRDIRQKLEEHHAGAKKHDDAADAARASWSSLDAELEALQGETPLMRVCVDASIIGEVLSGWTGIPVGKMMRDEMSTILELEKSARRARHRPGHGARADQPARAHVASAGIEDPQKPKGVFMLVGPSGVGKTETALAISDLLYGGEQNLITINMSEFQEAHTVSTLKGSPPGYVGYGEGGVLTEAVRRRPYSVVLLDEVEKAHPDVLELFFQVFDKGRMEDGEGREIDFKNTIIILTTNAGTETIMKLTADPETTPSSEGLVKALKPELDKTFKPAFLGRMVIIPFFPVRDENLKQIVRLKMDKVRRRIAETHKVELAYGGRRGQRGRRAVHRSRERRAQRRQHSHEHAAARDLAAHSRRDGEWRWRWHDHRRRRRRRRAHVSRRRARRGAEGPRRAVVVGLVVVVAVRGRTRPCRLSKEHYRGDHGHSTGWTSDAAHDAARGRHAGARKIDGNGASVAAVRAESRSAVERRRDRPNKAPAEAGRRHRRAGGRRRAVFPWMGAPLRAARARRGPTRGVSSGGRARGSGFSRTTTNCRIFQQMTVPDIVKKIFSDRSMSDYKISAER